MGKTYLNTLKQIEQLQREAEALKRREVDGVIARIRQAIAVYGLTAADLGLAPGAKPAAAGKAAATARKPRTPSKAAPAPSPKAAAPAPAKKAPRKLPIKFRDGQGHEWSGRGTRPRWFTDALAAGRTLEDLRA